MTRLLWRSSAPARRVMSTLKTVDLTDSFATQDTGKWSGWSADAAINTGRLRINATAAYPTIFSVGTYSLADSSIYVQLTTKPNVDNGSTEAALVITAGANEISFVWGGANVITRYGLIANDVSTAYNATNHRWVRIREAAGTLYWDTSANGTTWTNMRSVATPFTVTGATVRLKAGNYNAAVTPGFAEFDNLNVPPVASTITAFGTLVTDGGFADDEWLLGCRLMMQELSWNSAETANGTWSTTYWNNQRGWRNSLQAAGAGRELTLGLGMHNGAPTWLATAATNPRFINQSGATSNFDFVWNSQQRAHAEDYFARINTELGINNYVHVRLTNPVEMEALFNFDGDFDAYGPNPQGTGGQLPSGMPVCPFPGWRPGDTNITIAQVGQWVDWYYGAMARTMDWQMTAIRALGYTGDFEIICPGAGLTPSALTTLINNRLTGANAGLVGQGAAWHKLYELLPNKTGVYAHCSSFAESASGADRWSAADATVSMTSATYNGWGAFKRMKRIAVANGIEMTGENPGYGDDGAAYYGSTALDTTSMLYNCGEQARTGDIKRFYWAHSYRLRDGFGPTMTAYGNRIAAVQAAQGG